MEDKENAQKLIIQEKMKDYITIIGAGLAGSEAAYQIAKAGIKVKLYEMKPKKFTEAHSNKNFAEIVCSNSFKSNLHTNACGLLKEELRKLDSLLIRIADEVKVPAGQALAVDREIFAKKVTEEINKNPLIEVISVEVGSDISIKELSKNTITIIATGPLTSESLAKEIQEITGQDKFYFYDAAAPIVTKDSVDFSIAFYGDRYIQEKKKDETVEEWLKRVEFMNSYINLPFTKEEYEKFWKELVEAEDRVVYTLEEDKNEFTVRKEDDMFIIEGKAINRLMGRINIDDNESMYYFQKNLDELGVNQRLKEMGIQEGDIVKIADYELEWED